MRYAARLRLEALEARQLLAAVVAPIVEILEPTTIGGNWNLDFEGDRNSPEASARNFLSSRSTQLGIESHTGDLLLKQVKHGLASSHTRFQLATNGIPVHGATITVNQNHTGNIENFFAHTFPKLTIPAQAVGGLSFAAAQTQALDSLGIDTPTRAPRGQLVWLPLSDNAARLAWQVEISSHEPVGDFVTLLDAQTGEIYSEENRLAFATGTGHVYEPNPYQTQGSGAGLTDSNDSNSTRLSNERVEVTLQGLDSGTGLLRGEYVDLSTFNSPTLPDVDANEPTRVYDYTRDDPRFEQVNIYHSIDSIQRYFHTLGFDDANPTPNGIRDFPTMVNAHWNNNDQSFYDPGNDSLHFGDGGVDDGEDSDIVAHEYGHAIQHDQNLNWGGGEMGAMGEGFGDYLAASFYADDGDPSYQASHAACVGDWDAVSYSNASPPCLRRVDGSKMYPNDLDGSVHSDGEIWSAALWNLRSELGAEITDTLVLEHHFALPAAATMPTAARAMLAADQNLNGGDNEVAISTAFCDRGILSGAQCDLDMESVEGVKWHDLDASGVQENGELGLADWQIYWDINGNDQLDSFSITPSLSGGPLSIPDEGSVVAELDVSQAAGRLTEVSVTLSITHTWVEDLTVELEAPSGERFTLFSEVGDSGNNFTNTVLTDSATTPIGSGSAPFTGAFQPQNPLSNFNGLDPNGTWKLHIADGFDQDVGTLDAWSLSLEGAEPSALTDANGAYTLDLPTAGTYTLAEVQQAGWSQTFPVAGIHSVTLSAGETRQGVDFGNREVGSGSTIVGRHLFYNNSSFDGFDPAANTADQGAIASDKSPLTLGEGASLANYSSYFRGLNGVIIDIDGRNSEAPAITLADLELHVGNDKTPINWDDAPMPTVTFTPAGGAGGADRVTLTWADRAIANQWLEVRVLPTTATGLAVEDLFYFGNAIGETGDTGGSTLVDAADFEGVRSNPKSFLEPAAVDNVFDLNRDSFVNASDLIVVREFASELDDLLTLLSL